MQSSKKAKAVDLDGSIDYAAALEEGTLSKLTMDQLKDYLRAHSLKLAGKKDELVARVTEHLGSG